MLEDFVRCAECAVEELAWIRISLVREMPFEVLVRLLTEFELPETIFEMPRHAVARVAGDLVAGLLMSAENESRAVEIQAWLRKAEDRGSLTIADPDYPDALKHGAAPAPVLYLRGRRELLSAPMIGLVGSERADAEGIATAAEFSKALAARGNAVLVDLMGPLSASAARAAIAAAEFRGGVIAVSATGIDRAYPSASRETFVEVAREGLLLSPRPPGVSRDEMSEEARRATLVGLAQKLLVIQAEIGSPVMGYARLAADLGREVLAVPGSIHSALHKGCHRLIRDGATLTESVRDIVP